MSTYGGYGGAHGGYGGGEGCMIGCEGVGFGWLTAVGCVGDLGGAGLSFFVNLFRLTSRSCLSYCMCRYWGVVGVGGLAR